MRTSLLSAQFLALFAGLLIFTSCQQDETVMPTDKVSIQGRSMSTPSIPSVVMYGLSTSNGLYTYYSGPPAKLMNHVPISGLKEGEVLMAIDVRPATRELYGVSNMSTIYTIDAVTGFAMAVSAIPFTPALAGSMVGFDFDPRTDLIRLVTDKDQNLRISPVTGLVTHVDYSLNPLLPSINSIAYSFTSSTSSASSLYDIDIIEGKLYRQNPNTGTLSMIGYTGLEINGEGGFDISSGNAAFGVFLASGGQTSGFSSYPDDLTQETYRLYSLDLRTGRATSLGQVKSMIGMAIQY